MKKQSAGDRSEPFQMPHLDMKTGQYPVSIQHALRFAEAHDRALVLYFIEDEDKVAVASVLKEDL